MLSVHNCIVNVFLKLAGLRLTVSEHPRWIDRFCAGFDSACENVTSVFVPVNLDSVLNFVVVVQVDCTVLARQLCDLTK